MNLFFLDFLFLVIYNSYKLISLVDRSFLFQSSGSKLQKYISYDNQPKLVYSFRDSKKYSNFILNFFFKSPVWCKRTISCLLTSLSITFIKIVLSYRYLFSNFFYISIFNNNFDLVLFLKEKYFYCIIIYYFLTFIFISNILCNITKKISKIKNKNNEENNPRQLIYLGINEKNNEVVKLSYKGLYQNLLITGSIGSGKTSSGISNLVEGFIKNNTGGLIIDVKGNYIKTLDEIMNKYDKKEYQVISLNNEFKYNPLNKPFLSSIELANYMMRVLKVLSIGNNNSDPYWLDKSESYIRDFITLIRIYNNNFVNFYEIHKLVTNNFYLEMKIDEIKSMILNNKFEDKTLFEINSAINNIKNEYLKLDERIVGIIKSEITRLTNIFVSNYTVYDKFCTTNDSLNFLSGKVILLSLDIGQNKLLSKIIATYIKLDFQQQILSRKKYDEPVFFICDEFQEIVNLEDSDFFSVSREYKSINVISVQSYTSIINALKDEKTANVIIQNLVNKIWFRNDDMYTVKEIIKQVGKEEKKIESLSYTESGQNSKYNILENKFKDYKTGLSKSYTYNSKNEYKFNEEYITCKLNTFEAICFLSDGEKINVIDKLKLKRWGEIYEK